MLGDGSQHFKTQMRIASAAVKPIPIQPPMSIKTPQDIDTVNILSNENCGSRNPNVHFPCKSCGSQDKSETLPSKFAVLKTRMRILPDNNGGSQSTIITLAKDMTVLNLFLA